MAKDYILKNAAFFFMCVYLFAQFRHERFIYKCAVDLNRARGYTYLVLCNYIHQKDKRFHFKSTPGCIKKAPD
jgi:hypothetical protein